VVRRRASSSSGRSTMDSAIGFGCTQPMTKTTIIANLSLPQYIALQTPPIRAVYARLMTQLRTRQVCNLSRILAPFLQLWRQGVRGRRGGMFVPSSVRLLAEKGFVFPFCLPIFRRLVTVSNLPFSVERANPVAGIWCCPSTGGPAFSATSFLH
jgi:hypothetical protein